MTSAKNNGENIVVTDMALVEMMKSDQWESTTKRSLSILATEPQLVICSKGIGPMMKEEYDSGAPCAYIFDDEVSNRFRRLLGEVSGGDDTTFEHVRKVIGAARDLAKHQHLDHGRNKAALMTIVDAWKKDLTAEQLRRLRGSDEQLTRELLSESEMQSTCFNALVGAGYDRSKAARLTMDPSVSSHEFLCFVAVGLRWLDGLGAADEKKVTNDLADKDYVVTATFCRDLVSEEKRVQEQFARINDVIDRRARLFESIVQSSLAMPPEEPAS